jgi:heptosyltransferase II
MRIKKNSNYILQTAFTMPNSFHTSPIAGQPCPKRILIIPPRFIGDTVLASTLIQTIHAAWPDTQIHLLLPAYLKNLYDCDPLVDDILILEKGFLKNLQQLWPRDYDMGLLLRKSLSQAALLKLGGVRHVVGFKEQQWLSSRWEIPSALFLDEAVPYPSLKSTMPHLRLLSQILNPLGFSEESLAEACCLFPPKIHVDAHDNGIADFILQKHNLNPEKTAIIHIHSASREKAMAVEQFAPAIQILVEHGFSVVALGSKADAASYKTLSDLCGTPIINLCGETSLRESTALLARAALLFSLDSGPVHLAASVNIKHIIAVYGPTNDKQWQPWPYSGYFSAITNLDLSCRPCKPKVCEHNRCRTGLTPEVIAKNVSEHLKAYGP